MLTAVCHVIFVCVFHLTSSTEMYFPYRNDAIWAICDILGKLRTYHNSKANQIMEVFLTDLPDPLLWN